MVRKKCCWASVLLTCFPRHHCFNFEVFFFLDIMRPDSVMTLDITCDENEYGGAGTWYAIDGRV